MIRLTKSSFLVLGSLIVLTFAEETQEDCRKTCTSVNGYFADCTRCDYFIQCANGVMYRQECGKYMWFNPSIRTCTEELPAYCDSQGNYIGKGASQTQQNIPLAYLKPTSNKTYTPPLTISLTSNSSYTPPAAISNKPNSSYASPIKTPTANQKYDPFASINSLFAKPPQGPPKFPYSASAPKSNELSKNTIPSLYNSSKSFGPSSYEVLKNLYNVNKTGYPGNLRKPIESSDYGKVYPSSNQTAAVNQTKTYPVPNQSSYPNLKTDPRPTYNYTTSNKTAPIPEPYEVKSIPSSFPYISSKDPNPPPYSGAKVLPTSGSEYPPGKQISPANANYSQSPVGIPSTYTSPNSSSRNLQTPYGSPKYFKECVFNCNNKPDGQYGDCEYCNTYITCQQGYEVFHECPFGDYYNYIAGRCQKDVSYICVPRPSSVETPASPAVKSYNQATENQQAALKTSNTAYISQSRPSQSLVVANPLPLAADGQGPSDELEYSSVPVDDYLVHKRCLNSCFNAEGPELDGQYGLCGHCNEYIICTNGKEIKKYCKDKFIYNASLGRCASDNRNECSALRPAVQYPTSENKPLPTYNQPMVQPLEYNLFVQKPEASDLYQSGPPQNVSLYQPEKPQYSENNKSEQPKYDPSYQQGQPQYDPNYQQGQPQYDPNYQQGQPQYDPNYQQGQPQYDSSYQQGHPQYDPKYQQGQPQYDPSYQQGQPQYDPSYQQGQPQYDPNYQQGQPQYDPNYQQGQPQYDPNYQQGQPQYDPSYQQGQPQYDLNNQRGQPQYDPNYQQGQPQYDPSYQQRQPQYDPSYQQRQPQYDPNYQQGQPQYDPNYQQGQPQYDPSYQQGQPQYELNNQRGQPQYDPNYQQGQPQYDPSYQQGQPQYDPSYQQGQPQYDSNYQQRQPQYDPNYQQGQPQYDSNYQQGQPQYDPNYQQGQVQYDPNYQPSRLQ